MLVLHSDPYPSLSISISFTIPSLPPSPLYFPSLPLPPSLPPSLPLVPSAHLTHLVTPSATVVPVTRASHVTPAPTATSASLLCSAAHSATAMGTLTSQCPGHVTLPLGGACCVSITAQETSARPVFLVTMVMPLNKPASVSFLEQPSLAMSLVSYLFLSYTHTHTHTLSLPLSLSLCPPSLPSYSM